MKPLPAILQSNWYTAFEVRREVSLGQFAMPKLPKCQLCDELRHQTCSIVNPEVGLGEDSYFQKGDAGRLGFETRNWKLVTGNLPAQAGSKLETGSRRPACVGRSEPGNSNIGRFEAGILMKTKIKMDPVRAHCRHCRLGRVSKTSRVPRGGRAPKKNFTVQSRNVYENKRSLGIMTD